MLAIPFHQFMHSIYNQLREPSEQVYRNAPAVAFAQRHRSLFSVWFFKDHTPVLMWIAKPDLQLLYWGGEKASSAAYYTHDLVCLCWTAFWCGQWLLSSVCSRPVNILLFCLWDVAISLGWFLVIGVCWTFIRFLLMCSVLCLFTTGCCFWVGPVNWMPG